MRQLLIFSRAFAMVLCTTSNVYLIANKHYVAVMFISVAISTIWTLNVKDLAISTWLDRLAYIVGGLIGTGVSLFILTNYI